MRLPCWSFACRKHLSLPCFRLTFIVQTFCRLDFREFQHFAMPRLSNLMPVIVPQQYCSVPDFAPSWWYHVKNLSAIRALTSSCFPLGQLWLQVLYLEGTQPMWPKQRWPPLPPCPHPMAGGKLTSSHSRSERVRWGKNVTSGQTSQS